MPNETETEAGWLAIIARSLAFLCLSEADLRDKGVLLQAQFLEGLGLSRVDAASMLGTSSESLRVMAGRAKGGKKGKSHGKAKTKGR
jgi:hypothetical protein